MVPNNWQPMFCFCSLYHMVAYSFCEGPFGQCPDPSTNEDLRPFRMHSVAIKCFSKNTYFSEMLIFGKGKCIQLFGCLGNCFPENQFWCLVRPNILRKMLYGKSIPMFGSVKHFTKNEIRFLRKINSSVWFVNHFTENMKCVTNSSTCIIQTNL